MSSNNNFQIQRLTIKLEEMVSHVDNIWMEKIAFSKTRDSQGSILIKRTSQLPRHGTKSLFIRIAQFIRGE